MDAQSLKTDLEFKHGTSGAWCLSKKGQEPWMVITLASVTDKSVICTISTNDAEVVKKTLVAPGQGLFVRSFQLAFSCDYPDNMGIGIADVYEFREASTKKGELIHMLRTKFGCSRIGGPALLKAGEVRFGTEVLLYEAKPPERHYYGG